MPIDPSKVLRLNLPQWQGGDRPFYRIEGRVLAALAPDPQGPEETVPVPAATEGERPLEQGILSRAALLRQVGCASRHSGTSPDIKRSRACPGNVDGRR
jgi:arginase